MNGQPLTFVVAAGPYTLDDNLLFEPLQELVDRILEEQPDLIVLIVDNVVCVNPAHLTRKQAGGMYARMTLHPLQRQVDGTVGEETRAWERTRVDLVRI
ncbi:hypothetical protein BC936DRAFT_144641 [Jimgerdemannia flammicorona]|uniref:Uncharacterized protein n=1 Tax=Jimgerdemannia flammicorona TaxID=994334 RepID=A0A433DC43_9FUNG|nr:hypothetical protein BC936DRAFT_144641 [Jimgerdemannia flammicorona]